MSSSSFLNLSGSEEKEQEKKVVQPCQGLEAEEGCQGRHRRDQTAVVEDKSESPGPAQAAVPVFRGATQEGEQVRQTRVRFATFFRTFRMATHTSQHCLFEPQNGHSDKDRCD